jgi:hypothetical protein
MVRYLLCFVSGTVLLSSAALAQGVDWRAEIGADMVQVVDGKMVYEDYEICGVAGSGSRMQIKHYAEAPVGAGISRDFFISQAVALNAVVIYGVMAEASGMGIEAFIEAFDCDPISAAIGTVDLELKLFMTADGFQYEVVDTGTGERERASATWAEAFAD